MDYSNRRSKPKELPISKSPSVEQTTSTFSTKSLQSQSEVKDDAISEEFDIDDKVIRSTTNRFQKLEYPILASIENSRIIHVLHANFPLDLTRENDWPNFDLMKPAECIEHLGELTGCDDHEENLISFWILDTLSEVIRQGQLNGISNENLNVICIWFSHQLKFISVYSPQREDFFVDLNQMLFEAENEYLESGKILLPNEILERLKSKIVDNEGIKLGRVSLVDLLPSKKDIEILSEESWNSEQGTYKNNKRSIISNRESGGVPFEEYKYVPLEAQIYEDCPKLNEFIFLTEQMYRIFGNRFKYEVIKTVFSTPQEMQPIVVVESMNFPKKIGLSEKQNYEINLKKRMSIKPNRSKPATEVIKKSGKKGHVEKEQSNAAIERFKSEMRALDYKRIDEAEKEKTKHLYIKPLEDAVDAEYFQLLFPKKEPEIPTKESDTKPTVSPKKKNNEKK